MSALLVFKVCALVPVAITTLASHLGIQHFPLSLFHIPPAFPKAFGTWSCTQSCKQSSNTYLFISCLFTAGGGKESVHCGATPLASTYLLSALSNIFCPLYLLGRPAAMNPQVIPIQSDRLVFLVLRRLLPWMDPKRSPYISCSPTGCCHGKIQSDLLNPSLLKRARAPSGRPPLAFSRSPLDSLLAGFLLLFLILDDFRSVLHPRIFSLSRLTGWASTPTCLGAPSLVVWLGLTTSWRRTTERKLSGL